MAYDRSSFRVRHLVIVAMVLLVVSCSQEEDPRLSFLIGAESAPAAGSGVSSERVSELRADIARHEAEIQDVTRRWGQVATFQKLLANELMSEGLFGPALDALERGLALQPDNAVLHYLAGVAAAQVATATISEAEQRRLFGVAEARYRDALERMPDYREALYGLSVLLGLEMDRASEALPFARRMADLETGDPTSTFLLANILVRAGEVDEAADLYAVLARTAPSADQRRQAAANRDALTGGSR